MSTTFDLASGLNVRKTLIAGAGWHGAAEICRVGLSFLVMIVLAMLLSPEDFGLVGMTDVFVSLLMVFMAMGFDSAIVQQEVMTEEILSTLFWVNILSGVVLSLAGSAIAPLLGWFYRDPRASLVFVFVSAGFVIEALSVVQRGLLQRQMNFRNLAIIDVCTTVGASAIALAIAFLGGGYWSLVAQQLGRRLFAAIGYWITSPWRPRLRLNLHSAHASIQFSLNLLLYNTLNFATTQSDSLIIGRLLGAEQLGIYLLARQLVTKPVGHLLDVVSRTLYPVLAAVHADSSRIRSAFLSTFHTLLLLIAPLVVLAGLAAPFVVPVYLGQSWSPLVPVLWVWCLGTIRGIATSRVTILFLATGRPDMHWKYQAVAAPVVILGMLLGIGRGALGVSIGYVAAQTLMALWALRLALPLIGLHIPAFLGRLRWVGLALFAEMLAGGVGAWAAHYLELRWYLGLALTVLPAGCLYCLSVYGFDTMARGLCMLGVSRLVASGRSLAWRVAR